MCRKLIYVIVLVFGLTLPSVAGATDPNLVAWWTFDETSGTTAADSSGNGHTGTLIGGPQWVAGKIGGALQFDGTDDYVDCGNTPKLTPTRRITVALWFKTAGFTRTWETLLAKGDDSYRLSRGGGTGNAGHFGCTASAYFNGTTIVTDDKWHHLAGVFDGSYMIIYVDGKEDNRQAFAGPIGASTYNLFIAENSQARSRYFRGLIDDVRIYNRALMAAEIKQLIPPQLKAENPSPPDGAQNVTMPLLQWTAGETAAFHDVYFGTNPNPGPAEFRGRQPFTMYWHAPGLTPGTTYYWRIDEVEADGVTIHSGDVWSFISVPVIARGPSPADGARLVDTEADLSWTAGAGAITHDVYFGTNQADVAAGTGGTFKGNQPATKYDPGPLAKDTTYYWRIDEVEADRTTKHTGQVWRFRTMPDMPITDPNLVGWWKFDEGFGTTAFDWSGHNNHGRLMGDPQWVEGIVGGALQFNGTNAYVSAPYIPLNSQSFTIAMWVNPVLYTSEQIVFSQTQSRSTNLSMHFRIYGPNSGRVRMGFYNNDLDTSGNTIEQNNWYHITFWYDFASQARRIYVNGEQAATATGVSPFLGASGATVIGSWDGTGQWFRGIIDDVRVYKRTLTPAEIKEVMRGEPDLAWNPRPDNKSTTDVEKAVPLTWTPGEKAAKHDVYLGTDQATVDNADTTDTTGIYRGRQDPNSYSPPGGLEFGRTYYWRIDEFNTDGTISTGRIWSFTVADYLIVDDFEDYDDTVNRIFDVWADYFVNNTGATVGYFDPPFAEQTIVHSGSQSMPYRYDNDGTVNEGTAYEKTGTLVYSEVEREWAVPQDWTRKSVASLRLYFQGATMRFVDSAGTITMSAAGADIWGTSDQFRYAYKQLNGDGQIVAKVVSIGGPGTNVWRKAGVMIREGLDANSRNAFMAITPDVTHGVTFQNRPTMNGASVGAYHNVGFTYPAWVKLVRQGNQFTGYYSTNGVNWIQVPPAPATNTDASPNPQTINMSANAYIGLAVTSHQSGVSCVAQFSDVTITGATGAWTVADIGVAQPGNDPAPMYVVLQDSANKTAVVTHSDVAATLLDSWQEWNIALADFAGLNLRAIKKLSIGVGDRVNPQRGGSGRLFIDDIQLRLAPPAQ